MNKEMNSREISDSTQGGIRSQIQSIPKPDAKNSVIGLTILGLMLFGIVSYFPIYTYVIQEVLGLPAREGRSLALLLIIFIGLAGMFFDITIRYFGRKQENRQDTPQSKRSTGYVLLFISVISLLLVVTLCLWLFQAILYYQFYTDLASEKHLIPWALGAAAFFIAGIETLGFFWVTQLAFDFITWLFVSAVFIAPPYILAKVFRIFELLFKVIPSKKDKEEE